MGKRPTILDVASHAGVSKSTVSLVLQNSPLVKPSTRDLVEQSMVQINYVYNRSAAGLRGAATGLIGLVINDLRNPFFTEFAASAQMEFARRGYATVIANTDEDPKIQSQVVGSMIEHGVSALVISPAYGDGDDLLAHVERAGIPTLQVLRQIDTQDRTLPFASLDYAGGSALAAQHLVDQGAKRIAFLGGLPDRPITVERMEGYALVLAENAMQPLHIPGRPSRALGRSIARSISHSHPDVDAAVCFSDLVAIGALSGFAESGVKVGEEFLLVGFDDIEECSLVYPQLSSVRCDLATFAERAATAILEWVDRGTRPPTIDRLSVQMVPRQSSTGRGMT
ncbi:MAG: LacI family DNA-binding transcriptional regulator [Devosiaceae bacterium]